MQSAELSESERILADVLTRYARAARDKDVDAFVALYTDDVRVFDAWDRWSYEGSVAWRAAVSGWFRSVGDDQIVVTVSDLRADVAGGVAFGHALVRHASVADDGRELHAILNRHTWGLTCLGGTWKIRHEHSSVPVSFATHMAIAADEDGVSGG